MISSIPPISPSSPSGNPPDLTSRAKSFGNGLDTIIAKLSNLNPKNLDAQLSSVAQHLIDLSTEAKTVLKEAGK